MVSFLDLFGLRRRSQPRVAVGWIVDVKAPERDGYVGFRTVNIGVDGVHLAGRREHGFSGNLQKGKRVEMRLRLPPPLGPVDAEGELKWARDEGNGVQMGFYFTRIPRQARQMIAAHIEAHPGDIVEGEE